MASQSSATSRGQPREAACRRRTGGRHHYGTTRISRGFRAATPPHERGRRSRPAAGRSRPAGRAQPTLVESGSFRADPHMAHAIRTMRGSAPSSTLIRQCPSRSLEWGCGRKADTLDIRQLPARIAPGPEPGSCARRPATRPDQPRIAFLRGCLRKSAKLRQGDGSVEACCAAATGTPKARKVSPM